jgi:hypothetical protein
VDDDRSNVPATLAAYEQGVDAYLEYALPAPYQAYTDFLDRTAEQVLSGSHLLELGTGPGHDALYFESKGIRVR